MIKLNNTPNEGSTVKVNLGFRDSAGQYYIPTKIQYTVLALNNDKESWSIVDDLYMVSLTPGSSVVLTVPNVKTIEGTTLQRKIIVYWEAFIDNEYSSFNDDITFEIQPKPYVPNEPVNPPPSPTVYVEINSVTLQVGTLVAAPVEPVFFVRTNLPVNLDEAVALINGEIGCTITKDNTGTLLTIAPTTILMYKTSYTLKLTGLVSTINSYVMKDDFECAFVTQSDLPVGPFIQENKLATITANGETVVEPDEGYDAMAKVTLTVDVDLRLQEKTVTENGIVTPDSEYTGLSSVTVDVNPPLQEKTASVNGEVIPDTGYYGLEKVTVDVPLPTIETGKTVSFISNGIYNVEPTVGFDAMDGVEVTVDVNPPLQEKSTVVNGEITPDTGYYGLSKVNVNVPEEKPEQSKTITINANGVETVTPDTGKVLSSVEIRTSIPIESGKSATINNNGTTTISPTSGYTAMDSVDVNVNVQPPLQSKTATANGNVTADTGYYGLNSVNVAVPIEATKLETITSIGVHTITPTSPNVGMGQVIATVAIPLESNKTETLTSNGSHVVRPTTGNVGMEQATITVAVPIETGRTETLTTNGVHTINPVSPNVGMDSVEVTVAVPLESNKTESISVEDYITPVEITPTTGNTAMEKVTVTLTNLTNLYAWQHTGDGHIMYTTFSTVSKSNGTAYQCPQVKNAQLAVKTVLVNGDGLYVDGYPGSVYYRYPDADIS